MGLQPNVFGEDVLAWLNQGNHVDGSEKCMFCGGHTDRTTTLMTYTSETGTRVDHVYECVACRQERVRKQVEEGLRPASDLDEERFPENRREF